MAMENLRREMAALQGQIDGAPGLPPPGLSGWDSPEQQTPQSNSMQDLHGFLSQAQPQTDGTSTSFQAGPPLAPTTQSPPLHDHDQNVGSAQVLHGLMSFFQTAATNPAWGRQFWAWVTNLISTGALGPKVILMLQAKGYLGPQTVSPPDVPSLKRGLEELSFNTPQQFVPGIDLAAANNWQGASTNQFASGLPIDMKRAAPEIYRSIRMEGTSSVRQWVKDNYVGYKGPGAASWTDLWSTASSVDIALASCTSENQMIELLTTDDRLEVGLRHLGAFFYEQRTRDRVGAAHMRAFSTPGVTRDVMPTWMVADATTHSKAEYQRSERVEGEIRRRAKDGKGDAKGEGKGKKGKDGKSHGEG